MIRVQDLNKTYDRGRRNAHWVLRDVSFALPDTGFVCIVGASGCGKTSLLNAVGGLDAFDSGVIFTGAVSASRYGTRELERERNNNFGYIFQNYYLLSDHSVAYNVYLGLHALDLTHREKLVRVKEALKAVNMERYAHRVVGELSGGQQQRVAIARALARRPRVIFADEPTGNLDEENTLNICTLLRRISRTSLVVMVTHEENIARFFADRIITLSEGRITGDDDSWQRESLTLADSAIYAGDHGEERCETGQVSLRILHQEGAAPVNLTVAVLKDRIVLKLDDSRMVTCSAMGEEPLVLEGKRPVLTLESVDNEPVAENGLTASKPAQPARAGSGLTWKMMAREAGRLLRGKGLRRLSAWIFLAAMSVLTTIVVSDYLTVSAVEPEDFVITDSHILAFELERGPSMPVETTGILGQMDNYFAYLEDSGLDFDILPYVNTQLRYSTDVFLQMGTVSEPVSNFSHALISRLDESDLICGRMPERSDEIVVDRWVLDAFLEREGIIQSGIPGISGMLGARLDYFKKNYAPTIVGICDCGDPTIYLPPAGMVSAGVAGTYVLPLSELQAMCPGEYDDVTLGADQCIVVYNNAGPAYQNKVGSRYNAASGIQYEIVAAIEADTWAYIVMSDEAVEEMLYQMCTATTSFQVYCKDKAAMKAYLAQGLPEELDGVVLAYVEDANGDAWARYQAASHLKADARTIVTVTVIVLCMVMLFLLQRSCVQQRIGMMAVYRLLGIPRRKLLTIFSVESLLLSLLSVLPATALTWAAVEVMNSLPSLEFSMLLPWQAAGLVFLAITLYHLLVALLPVWRLLRLPPARLAGKYDI